jgi:hypothetical protein
MTLTKENRSIYLDEEIELLGKTVRRPIFKMYEQESDRRKRGDGVKRCGKSVFRDLEEVKEVLFLIKSKRANLEVQGLQTKRKEKRYYFCSRCH